MDSEQSRTEIWITQEIRNLCPDAKEDQGQAQVRVSDYFFDRLVTVLTRKFQLRGEAGAEDIANSVLRIAIHGIQQGHYQDFNCREDLWAFLMTVAVRKALN